PVLERDSDEVRALHDDLLIHVTHFFREPRCYSTLRAKALPRILKALPPDQPVRVWVPGCSTGEEAYSLAITILDFLSERQSEHAVQVFATDISESALEKARAAVYGEDVPEYVPARHLRRFFNKVDGGYQVAKRVRDMCVFARQDLTKDPPFGNVDIISCCNVLIYLGAAAQQRVFPKLHYALRPSGVLLLSKSESVGEFEDLFAIADRNCRLYYKRSAPRRSRLEREFPARPAAPSPAVRRPRETAPFHAPEMDIHKVAERILLDRYAPAGVVVGGDLSVLHYQGRVSRFLEPASGKASLNLARMLPPHTSDLVRGLLSRAKRSESPVRKAGVEWRHGRGAVEVVPFRLPLSGERYFIVVFDEGPENAGPRRGKGGREDASSLRRLRSELASTRSYLQTITEEHEAAREELKSANEEVTSANEELQSTNEELEIAKEELQASNEELTTLNDELQARNEGLGQLNSDLMNLIASVHLPIVMVSGDLRIRRFSPTAERVMNLIPSDVGRPLGDIKPKLSLPNIEEVVHGVIESVTPKEIDVRDAEGHSYAVRIRPYRTAENRIDGAVIVWVDNDPVRRGLKEIDESSAFEALLDFGPPLAVLDAQLRIKAGSRSLYQAFGLTTDALGKSLFEMDGGRWDVPALREPLQALSKGGPAFREVRASIGGKDLLFGARRTNTSASGDAHILLTISEKD
ncbi:MAG: PAS domain-containing protein, partial [Elusimicrobia bacterium]|nr:PAS domain-containing protein [Elusimicrobiota bacterium]